ncbi:MAG: transcriptional repressor NrdR [Clostridia bacterium]|nr:transcriptional repressor NrdR [Clostridia bacterium]
MKCPACGNTESKVLDSRPADGSIRRRRECLGCQRRFTTYERVEETPVMVVKKDGSRQLFDRGKIRDGIMHACQKRPVSYEEMDRLVKEVESAVQEAQVNEISSAKIGEMIMEGLKGIDEVAYVRFASVYRQFKDINTFMSELETLLQEQKKKGEF